MKKTLIALAAVAATSAAFAQSSVTVYGKVDMGISNAIGNATKAQTGLNEASGSRLGFRGTEDLGGGLKANFILEHRFKPDTGAESTPGTFWVGRSIVGLSGGFGKVDFGRDYSAAFWTALGADVFGYDGVANNAAATSASTNPARLANVISYSSPSMGGFMAQGSYAFKETAAAGVKNATSVRLAYAAGPLSASVAASKNHNNTDYSAFGAAYDFGMAKANLLISKGENVAGADIDGMTLGLVVPMGAVTLKASYATLEVGNVKTVSQLGLGARYALSKRTDVYTSYARNSKATVDKTGFEIGLQHNF
ncbi:MAG: porin [Hydrogenophaga sp.]|uniref:porin n=1 Tax=Hydrogenophaga sp. TaxID=1904254 RepID=UPI00273591B8|nr:porin [Hydrogenophaga sp.]MDP3343761.1 porin [Hydrogenophaga sp.]MDP3807157.1 porin [Hydrogenophaga sp.]MDP3927332.1 porin [Hydrogenophaga sp.]